MLLMTRRLRLLVAALCLLSFSNLALADDSPESRIYAEASAGISLLRPDLRNNDWTTGSDRQPAIGYSIGYQSKSFWEISASYYYLGLIDIKPRNTNLKTTSVRYQAISTSANFFLRDQAKSVNPYVLVGINNLFTDVSGEKRFVEQSHNVQELYGIGLELATNNEVNWSLEWRRFSGDVQLFSLVARFK